MNIDGLGENIIAELLDRKMISNIADIYDLQFEEIASLKKNGKKPVVIDTVLTAAPAVLDAFEKTEYAARLKACGVVASYICPLMYMNNPLCKTMPVITSSNKLRTYTTSRYYQDAEILQIITGGKI